MHSQLFVNVNLYFLLYIVHLYINKVLKWLCTRLKTTSLVHWKKYHAAFLIMLDLSTTFDTIDHGILFHFEHDFDIKGTSLQWFRSYMSGRTVKCVSVEKCQKVSPLTTMFPKGQSLTNGLSQNMPSMLLPSCYKPLKFHHQLCCNPSLNF